MTPHETDSTRTSGAARAHAPRRRRRTRAPMPATGATRGPVRGVGGRGGGCAAAAVGSRAVGQRWA